MSSSITVTQLQTQPQSQLIDVRSPSEFAAGHIPGAINIPMDQIESRLDDLSATAPIVLVCQMGKRARMTATLLDPCHRQLTVLEGGTNAWIAAGLLVLAGVALAITLNPHWLYLSGFIGLGLTFAGLTDFCPMAEFLAKLPWNASARCQLGVSRQENSHAAQ